MMRPKSYLNSGAIPYLAYVVVIVVIYVPIMFVSANTDDGIYMAVAGRLQEGDVLYRDIWDNKPPYLYYWYYLFHASPFGSQILLRLASAVLVALVPLAVYRAALVLGLTPPLAFFTGLLGVLAMRPSETFNATGLEAGFLYGAFLIFLASFRPGRRWLGLRPEIIAGMAFGMATMMKPTAGVVVFLLTFLYLTLKPDRSLREFFIGGSLSVLGFAIVFLPELIYLVATGTLDDAYRLVWHYNWLYSEGRSIFLSPSVLTGFVISLFREHSYILSPLFYFAIPGVLLHATANLREIAGFRSSEKNFVLFGAFAIVLGVALTAGIGGGVHMHYWVSAIAAFAILSAPLVRALFTFGEAQGGEFAGWGRAALLAGLIVAVGLPSLLVFGRFVQAEHAIYNVSARAFEVIKRAKGREDAAASVFVWGGAPRLYTLENIAPANGFITEGILLRHRIGGGEAGDAFIRFAWEKARQYFEAAPPDLIIAVYDGGTPPIEEEPEMESVLAGYDLIFKDTTAAIYRASEGAEGALQQVP